nr:hypothetical protein CFP56_25899 [Quercus suber]
MGLPVASGPEVDIHTSDISLTFVRYVAYASVGRAKESKPIMCIVRSDSISLSNADEGGHHSPSLLDVTILKIDVADQVPSLPARSLIIALKTIKPLELTSKPPALSRYAKASRALVASPCNQIQCFRCLSASSLCVHTQRRSLVAHRGTVTWSWQKMRYQERDAVQCPSNDRKPWRTLHEASQDHDNIPTPGDRKRTPKRRICA